MDELNLCTQITANVVTFTIKFRCDLIDNSYICTAREFHEYVKYK